MEKVLNRAFAGLKNSAKGQGLLPKSASAIFTKSLPSGLKRKVPLPEKDSTKKRLTNYFSF